MPTTDRPRKRHAAYRSRWATAALATAGTIGITGYLQFVQPAAATTTDATANDAQPADETSSQNLQALVPISVPPAPTVTVKVRNKSTPGAAPTAAPATVNPVYTKAVQPPVSQVQVQPQKPKQQASQATTRGSKG